MQILVETYVGIIFSKLLYRCDELIDILQLIASVGIVYVVCGIEVHSVEYIRNVLVERHAHIVCKLACKRSEYAYLLGVRRRNIQLVKML